MFWLTYRHPDGSAAGVVVIESAGLLHARLKVSLAGADRGLEFVSGHKLDPESARQIPEKMMGRLLDAGDLRKLHRMLLKRSRLRHPSNGGRPLGAKWASHDPPEGHNYPVRP